VSVAARATTLLIALVVVVAGITFVAMHFIAAQPQVVDYTPEASGGQVSVVMQTDPQNTVTNKPDWPSYFIQDPQTKQWVHSTFFEVPANTRVNVTIYGYDGCTPLRNPYFGKVTGTIGDVEYINGKPTSQLNSWSECSVQHTFTMPGLGISVPIASPTTLSENNNLCPTSPCTTTKGAANYGPYQLVQFSFMTPSKGGIFRWQCIIPCGLGYLDGNGGPMQTPGYMSGQMEVQAS
jgi:hypothetical protein